MPWRLRAGDTFRDRKLFEAKTGNSGFSDLFKVFGWMTYIGIKEGCVAHRDAIDPERLDAYKKVEKETGARCCHFSTASNFTDLAPAPLDFPESLREKLIATAWYGKIVQRLALANFNSYAKVVAFNIGG